jgi:hypothetical protein
MSLASAQTVRIANQGDALSMDPHSLNESLQLTVTGNVYEPLVGRARTCKPGPGAGHVLEADVAHRVALRTAQRRASSMTARRSPPTTCCSRLRAPQVRAPT